MNDNLEKSGEEKARPRFRVVVVGCGRISERHFEAIEAHTALELVAVCDEVFARARQRASERVSSHSRIMR